MARRSSTSAHRLTAVPSEADDYLVGNAEELESFHVASLVLRTALALLQPRDPSVLTLHATLELCRTSRVLLSAQNRHQAAGRQRRDTRQCGKTYRSFWHTLARPSA